MVALNGTPLNRTPVNGMPLNGSGAAVSTFPRDGAVGMQSGDGPRDDLVPGADHWTPPVADPWPSPEPDYFEVERTRLEAEIAAAKARADTARVRAAAGDPEVRAVLRAEFVASREALAEMERQHDATVSAVRAAAEAEVERILADARQFATGQSGRAVDSGPAGATDGD